MLCCTSYRSPCSEPIMAFMVCSLRLLGSAIAVPAAMEPSTEAPGLLLLLLLYKGRLKWALATGNGLRRAQRCTEVLSVVYTPLDSMRSNCMHRSPRLTYLEPESEWRVHSLREGKPHVTLLLQQSNQHFLVACCVVCAANACKTLWGLFKSS
jgi:hypothetical protein